MLALGDWLRLSLALGDTLALGLCDSDGLAEGDTLALGLADAEGLTDADALVPVIARTGANTAAYARRRYRGAIIESITGWRSLDADGLGLSDSLADGETLALGLSERLALLEGETDADGETEAEGLADGDTLALGLDPPAACRARRMIGLSGNARP